MKFVLSATNRFWWPVKVKMPDPDRPGKIVTQELVVLFEPKDQDSAIEDQARIAALPATDQIVAERQLLADVVRDWRDVLDEDKQPVPFSDKNLNMALQQSWFRTALWSAYAQSLAGQEARLGN